MRTKLSLEPLALDLWLADEVYERFGGGRSEGFFGCFVRPSRQLRW